MTTNNQTASRALTWPQCLGLRVGALHRRHGRNGVIVASIAIVAAVCLLFAVVDWSAVASAMGMAVGGIIVVMLFLRDPEHFLNFDEGDENESLANDYEADGWRDGIDGFGDYMGGLRVDEDA